jgi:uncharacterized protein (UPF0335 family)
MAQKKKSTSRTTDQQQSEPAAVQDPIAKLTEDIDAVYADLRSAATAVKELKQQLRTLKQQQKQQQREYKSAMDLIDRMQKLAA